MRCERETALLRAEILDLEDKYYALQAQQRSTPQTAASVLLCEMTSVGFWICWITLAMVNVFPEPVTPIST